MELNLACRQLFLANRRVANGFQYTVPSPTSYPYQWLWDSCFHAIVLSYFNTTDAKKEILSLLSKQYENGMIPHMIYWKRTTKADFPRIKWGRHGTSTITQPPMLAYAVWQIFKKSRDLFFLKSVYPNLYHFYHYLLTERDPHENHLIGIMNPDESGEDNSPRFDIPLKLPSQQTFKENLRTRFKLVKQNIECKFDAPFCMRNFFWVKDVPFNSIMVENLKMLAFIANKLGYKNDAIYFQKESDIIAGAMRRRMLQDNLFLSTYNESYIKIKVKTWAIFTPMFAKILTAKEAKRLIETHLLNKDEFWTKYPVATVSLDEPSFDPKGFWRGPVWTSVNWFIYKGLINYGYTKIAKELRQKTYELVQKEGFREYFDPLTGEGLGAQNFTWGALILDMD